MKKKHKKVLQEIHDSVPKEWYEDLITVEYTAKESREMVVQFIEEHENKEDLTEEEADRLQEFKDIMTIGALDAQTQVIDEEKSKKIEEFIDKEIIKAIEDGRLPDEDADYKRAQKKMRKMNRKKIEDEN